MLGMQYNQELRDLELLDLGDLQPMTLGWSKPHFLFAQICKNGFSRNNCGATQYLRVEEISPWPKVISDSLVILGLSDLMSLRIVLFYYVSLDHASLSFGVHSPAASTGSRAVRWTPPAGRAGRGPEQTQSG